MRSSYKAEDVTLLLKDITGMVKPQSTQEREKQIQAGTHYCEMLPIEYVPSEKYMQVYKEALAAYAKPTALAVGRLSDKIMEARGKDRDFDKTLYSEKIWGGGSPLFDFHYPWTGN